MSRRAAVLAALLVFVGKRGKGQERRTPVGVGTITPTPRTWLTVEIPERPEALWSPSVLKVCPGDEGSPNAALCEEKGEPPKPYTYILEVRYRKRVVRLTADEVMDALGGK